MWHCAVKFKWDDTIAMNRLLQSLSSNRFHDRPHESPALNKALYRGRFAPSPTGPLHSGSLLAALGSWLLARHSAGQWLVRIEDLDPPREVAGAVEAQLRTLAAMGLQSDDPVLRQSTRGDIYQAALDLLLASGDAFACHCSRGDLAAAGGVHRRCVGGARRHDPAIRFRVPPFTVVTFDDAIRGRIAQDVGEEVGDFVLRRADGLWAYQLAVVVDDAAQGITDVVRGADLRLDCPPHVMHIYRWSWTTTAASCRSRRPTCHSTASTRCPACVPHGRRWANRPGRLTVLRR